MKSLNKINYYGQDHSDAISYLEFGSINIEEGSKKIWGYWQDQEAYDLYMFSRYARDLFAFRKFAAESEKSVEKLNRYILNSAHTKLQDYIFKYSGMCSAYPGGGICESGSSLFGLIEESIACDYVFNHGIHVGKFQNHKYIASDISSMMNEGAAAFHSDIDIKPFEEPTLAELMNRIDQQCHTTDLAMFYGLSVSIRYAIRESYDLIRIALRFELAIFNRLSLSYGKTVKATYGTGKCVYTVSLPELLIHLKENGLSAKYYTSGMQYGKDGNNTVRVSVIISKNLDRLGSFMEIYDKCIEQSASIEGISKGSWEELEDLMRNKTS